MTKRVFSATFGSSTSRANRIWNSRGSLSRLLDRVDVADEKTAANLVIAANFTAEPLEDSLNFWGDHFGVPDPHRSCALQSDFSAVAGRGKRVSQEQRGRQRHPVGAGGVGREGAACAA